MGAAGLFAKHTSSGAVQQNQCLALSSRTQRSASEAEIRDPLLHKRYASGTVWLGQWIPALTSLALRIGRDDKRRFGFVLRYSFGKY